MQKIILFFIIIIFVMFLGITSVMAKDVTGAGCGPDGGSTTELCDPLNLGAEGVSGLIKRIITAVLGITGSLALIMVVYGGFIWMTSAGNAESVTKGKNILIWAIIGLAIIFSSYALVQFVFTSIGA